VVGDARGVVDLELDRFLKVAEHFAEDVLGSYVFELDGDFLLDLFARSLCRFRFLGGHLRRKNQRDNDNQRQHPEHNRTSPKGLRAMQSRSTSHWTHGISKGSKRKQNSAQKAPRKGGE